jgi:hypothetical protein
MPREIRGAVFGRVLRTRRGHHAQDAILGAAKGAGVAHVGLYQYHVPFPQGITAPTLVDDFRITRHLHRQFGAVTMKSQCGRCRRRRGRRKPKQRGALIAAKPVPHVDRAGHDFPQLCPIQLQQTQLPGVQARILGRRLHTAGKQQRCQYLASTHVPS